MKEYFNFNVQGIIRKDTKNVNNGRKTAGGILMELGKKECGLTNKQRNK